jgi:hypothetical protein
MLIETADDGPRNAAGFARAPSNASASVLTSFHEGYLQRRATCARQQ